MDLRGCEWFTEINKMLTESNKIHTRTPGETKKGLKKGKIRNKKMKSGDLKHDVQRGICTFGSSACGMYNLADYTAFHNCASRIPQ